MDETSDSNALKVESRVKPKTRPSRYGPITQGWGIAKRVGQRIVDNNLQVVTAGCAFYALFAIFPALWAAISLFGLTTDASSVDREFGMLKSVLPAQAYDIVIEEIRRIAETPPETLGTGFGIGLVIALWSANLGTQAMLSALNITYGQSEYRSLLRLYLSGFLCTALGIVGVVAMLLAVVYVPILFADTGDANAFARIVNIVRWPFLALLVMSLLALIYRFGPSRQNAKWQWIVVGAGLATIVWLLASAAFSYYVANFSANYDRMYGSLGAVIVLLFWLYITIFILLAGAEVDAVLETEMGKRLATESAEDG